VPVSRRRLARPAVELAPLLLGAELVSDVGADDLSDRGGYAYGGVRIRITEVEAYEGLSDPASHAFRGSTPRTAVMFGPAGFLYCYFTYGMHWCANIVCGPTGQASAVLLRAGDIIEGTDIARLRRPTARTDRDLARGPARLAAALGLGRAQNGVDLCAPDSPVRLLRLARPGPANSPAKVIRTGPRVGINQAADRPWRFWLDGEPSVSAFRPGVPRGPAATRPAN
jgi:DNA-3-methyladenine glycosylase